MLSIAPPPTIYLHTGTSDMRKSFDGQSGIIRGTFNADPSDGSLFLFVNKRRDRIKALWWDGDGYVLWHKRRGLGGWFQSGCTERAPDSPPGSQQPG
jgi:transposase